MRLKCTGPAEVLKTIAALGRTEDVSWSPNGRRIALAGIAVDKLLILGVDCRLEDGHKCIHVSDAMQVVSSSLKRPHGVCWVSDGTVAVASREGNVSFFDIPAAQRPVSACRLQPLATVGKGDTELLKSPGSLCARPLGSGLLELWVCNGFAHYVTHHLLDARSGLTHVDAQVLMREGLEVPDGVALDPAGDWVAISNHDRHVVALYRNDARLEAAARPSAELHGLSYPHGVCFAAGGSVLLVADAGTPHIALFRRAPQGWPDGASEPHALVRVLDDATFRKGQHNPREGGPKGVDVHEPWGLLVTTCAEQPLAFFDLEAILPPDLRQQDTLAPAQAAGEGLRTAMLRLARGVSAREALLMGAVRNEAALMRASWSWRVTAPLRSLAGGWLRWISRFRKH